MPRGSNTNSTSSKRPDRAPRVRRSPEERATQDLNKAQQRRDKAAEKLAQAQSEVEAAERELARAEHYLSFAQSNPDLPAAEVEEVETPETPEPPAGVDPNDNVLEQAQLPDPELQNA
jgi:hypothetical protein